MLLQALSQQVNRVAKRFVGIGELELRGHLAGEIHQLFHDLAADQRRIYDALEVASALAFRFILLQQFRIAQHVAERRVQFVRDARGDLRENGEPVVAAHAGLQQRLPLTAFVAFHDQGKVRGDLVQELLFLRKKKRLLTGDGPIRVGDADLTAELPVHAQGGAYGEFTVLGNSEFLIVQSQMHHCRLRELPTSRDHVHHFLEPFR